MIALRHKHCKKLCARSGFPQPDKIYQVPSTSFTVFFFLLNASAKVSQCISIYFISFSSSFNAKSTKNTFVFSMLLFRTGDERIELPPKVLETPIIPFDQSPIFCFYTKMTYCYVITLVCVWCIFKTSYRFLRNTFYSENRSSRFRFASSQWFCYAKLCLY